MMRTYLEPLVLQHLFDRDVVTLLWPSNKLRLEDHAKRAISDHLAIAIGYLPRVARLAIGSNNLDHLVWVIDSC